MKHYIECPFYEKDEAKSLGARWDSEERKWYYTDPSKKNLFKKWLRNELLALLPDQNSEEFGRLPEKDDIRAYYLFWSRSRRNIIEFDNEGGYLGYEMEYSYCNMEQCNGETAVSFYEGPAEKFWKEYDMIYEEDSDQPVSEPSTRFKDALRKCYECNGCEYYPEMGGGSPKSYYELLSNTSHDKLYYLGMFKNVNEAREFLKKLGIL